MVPTTYNIHSTTTGQDGVRARRARRLSIKYTATRPQLPWLSQLAAIVHLKGRHVNKDGSLHKSRTGWSRNWRFVFTQKALSFVFGFQGVASADAREDKYRDW